MYVVVIWYEKVYTRNVILLTLFHGGITFMVYITSSYYWHIVVWVAAFLSVWGKQALVYVVYTMDGVFHVCVWVCVCDCGCENQSFGN